MSRRKLDDQFQKQLDELELQRIRAELVKPIPQPPSSLDWAEMQAIQQRQREENRRRQQDWNEEIGPSRMLPKVTSTSITEAAIRRVRVAYAEAVAARNEAAADAYRSALESLNHAVTEIAKGEAIERAEDKK